MKTATLRQGRKLLELVEEIPAEHLQMLIEGGYISDLLKANVIEMNRDDFRKLCGLSPTFHFISTFDRNMREEGWTLEKDNEDREGDFIPELVNIFKEEEGEERICGEELLHRAGVCYGQRYAEAMIRDQRKIPQIYQHYYLPFPGTIWLDSDGYWRIPCLCWDRTKWYLSFFQIRGDFRSPGQLVRSRK